MPLLLSQTELLNRINVLMFILERVRNLNIQISRVLAVGMTADLSVNLISMADRQVIRQVEDGLLPMGVLGVR